MALQYFSTLRFELHDFRVVDHKTRFDILYNFEKYLILRRILIIKANQMLYFSNLF